MNILQKKFQNFYNRNYGYPEIKNSKYFSHYYETTNLNMTTTRTLDVILSHVT